jgi:hypothetical protein
MIIKSLTELPEADERTLLFSPLGVGPAMRPEDSAEFLQQVMARHELVPAVAEGTRLSFDRLRDMFGYGLLCYDIFTLLDDHALLVLEQALRDRFIDFHQGTVTFVHSRTGEVKELAAARYDEVQEFVSGNRSWKLRLGGGPQTMAFNGMLGGLREWARLTGLLKGQRNRVVEEAIMRLRNHAAHPSSYHLTTPADAASAISDLAEIINHLWGSPTPGGRLYPAPAGRAVVHLMWHERTAEVRAYPLQTTPVPGGQETRSRNGMRRGAARRTETDQAEEGWTHLLVRGAPDDWDLLHFDARYQTGRIPAEWLWGPGTLPAALDWLAREQPPGDEVDVLDQIFLFRYHACLLYLPRSPGQAASVTDPEKPGTWYLLKADSPEHAGSWQQAMGLLAERGVQAPRRDVPDVWVPARMGWPRCNRILGGGSWDIPPGNGRLRGLAHQPGICGLHEAAACARGCVVVLRRRVSDRRLGDRAAHRGQRGNARARMSRATASMSRWALAGDRSR